MCTSRVADSDHWTFDCVCVLCGAASAVARTRPVEENVESVLDQGGAAGPALTGTPCLSLTFKGEPNYSAQMLRTRFSFATFHKTFPALQM